MILAHRIRLVPTGEQEASFRRACGVARFAYNWALAEWQRQYHAGEKPSEVITSRAVRLTGTSALLSGDLLSANNASNLPAYTRLSAAALLQLNPRLTLTLTGTNITNTYVGYFVSLRYAISAPTLDGEPFPVDAGPLAHSGLYVELHYTSPATPLQ